MRNGGRGAPGGRFLSSGVSVCEDLWKETPELIDLVCWTNGREGSCLRVVRLEIDF